MLKRRIVIDRTMFGDVQDELYVEMILPSSIFQIVQKKNI